MGSVKPIKLDTQKKDCEYSYISVPLYEPKEDLIKALNKTEHTFGSLSHFMRHCVNLGLAELKSKYKVSEK